MTAEFTKLTKPMKLIVFIGAMIALAIIYAMFYSLFSSHVILRSSVDEPDVSGSLFVYGIKISLLLLLFYSLTVISFRLWLRKLESFGIAIRNKVTGVLSAIVLLLSQVIGYTGNVRVYYNPIRVCIFLAIVNLFLWVAALVIKLKNRSSGSTG